MAVACRAENQSARVLRLNVVYPAHTPMGNAIMLSVVGGINLQGSVPVMPCAQQAWTTRARRPRRWIIDASQLCDWPGQVRSICMLDRRALGCISLCKRWHARLHPSLALAHGRAQPTGLERRLLVVASASAA